jgi:hypothetical protein
MGSAAVGLALRSTAMGVCVLPFKCVAFASANATTQSSWNPLGAS